MRKPVTPTQLRANLFQILDEVLESGEPCEVIRGKRTLRIVPDYIKRRNLDNLEDLPERSCLAAGVSYDELVDVTWEYEPDLELFK